MNKLKAVISVVAAVVGMFQWGMYAEAEEYCGTLRYITSGDKSVVTGVTGEPTVLDIPARIDGREVVEIRENAFYKCESLEKVVIPDTVKFVGHHAFYECSSLEQVVMSDNIYSIDEGCFWGCVSLDEINFPENLRVIEENSFYGCRSLENLELPVGVEEIGAYAFANCTELSYVDLGENLISAGDFSFFNCKKLKEISVPSSVSSIGGCAIGYSGDTPVPLKDFKIVGDENSLGKMYAQSNGMEFEDVDSKTGSKKMSAVPVMAVIFSGAGLLFFQYLEKLKGFKRKYEYEC